MTYINESERPVVVGVDGSASALHAARWAAQEAERRHAPLRLVHVCHLEPVRQPRHVPFPRDYYTAVLAQGRHWLTEASAAAHRTAPGLPVITDQHAGLAAELLITESRTAQLVVLGSRGLGGFTSLLVGSVAVAVSAHGHCPVVVVHPATRDGAPRVAGPVVVGVDGSELSDAALAFAFEEAAARDVELVAVHTWQDPHLAGAWPMLVGPTDWDRLQEQAEKVVAERLTVWREKFPHVRIRLVVKRGGPEHALLEHAAGAQLVVVGSRGRGVFAGMSLGSVSQALLHHAECPVAITRTEQPQHSTGSPHGWDG